MDPLANALATYGPGGVLAAVIFGLHWYSTTRTIPMMIAAFRAEMEAERQACQRHHDEQMQSHRLTQELLMNQLRERDA